MINKYFQYPQILYSYDNFVVSEVFTN